MSSFPCPLLTACVDFRSKKMHVNLNHPIEIEEKAGSPDVLQAIDKDRKYALQATIVRYARAFFVWLAC